MFCCFPCSVFLKAVLFQRHLIRDPAFYFGVVFVLIMKNPAPSRQISLSAQSLLRTWSTVSGSINFMLPLAEVVYVKVSYTNFSQLYMVFPVWSLGIAEAGWVATVNDKGIHLLYIEALRSYPLKYWGKFCPMQKAYALLKHKAKPQNKDQIGVKESIVLVAFTSPDS